MDRLFWHFLWDSLCVWGYITYFDELVVFDSRKLKIGLLYVPETFKLIRHTFFKHDE
jgi:hypothetical protein